MSVSAGKHGQPAAWWGCHLLSRGITAGRWSDPGGVCRTLMKLGVLRVAPAKERVWLVCIIISLMSDL